MKSHWITKNKDMHIAQRVMEEYARQQNSGSLSLLELVVNQEAKRMDFRLSNWVLALLEQYHLMYGENRGEEITRLVLSTCMVNGQPLH